MSKHLGTAAVAVGGLYASTRVTGKTFMDHKIMFVGAGEAAIGIADLCCKAMEADGIPQDVSYSLMQGLIFEKYQSTK